MLGNLEKKLHRNFKLTKHFKFQKCSSVCGVAGNISQISLEQNNKKRPVCGEVADEIKANSKGSDCILQEDHPK